MERSYYFQQLPSLCQVCQNRLLSARCNGFSPILGSRPLPDPSWGQQALAARAPPSYEYGVVPTNPRATRMIAASLVEPRTTNQNVAVSEK